MAYLCHKTKLMYGLLNPERLELARRYHFMLLTVLMKTRRDPSNQEKQEVFDKYEQMIKDLGGDIEEEKVVFLKTLPLLTDWNPDEAYKLYLNSPFHEIPS